MELVPVGASLEGPDKEQDAEHEKTEGDQLVIVEKDEMQEGAHRDRSLNEDSSHEMVWDHQKGKG